MSINKTSSGSLKMERNGTSYEVQVKIGSYPSTGNLEAKLILTDKLGQETVLPLSMDVDEVCRQNCTIVNIGEKDAELLGWLCENDVFYSIGRYSKAGYPEVRFNIYDVIYESNRRPELDLEGFAAYTAHFEDEENKAKYREKPQVSSGKFPLIVQPGFGKFSEWRRC